MGIGLLTLLAVQAAAQAGRCGEDPDVLLIELESAALEGRVEEAEVLKEHALRGLGCGGLVERAWLARWWLAEAAVASLQGDEQSTQDALAAAASLAPEVWVEGYGPGFRSRHQALAKAGRSAAQGRLVLSVRVEGTDQPGEILAAVDGQPVQGFGTDLSAGYHLLQIGYSSNDIRHASVIYVLPDQDLVVRAILPALPQLPPEEPVPVPIPRKIPPFLVAAGVLGAGATATGLLALGQNGAMRDAQSVEELDSAYQAQRALGATSYVLMGATVICFSLEIAL